MKIGSVIGTTTAVLVSAIAVTGGIALIAADLLGAGFMSSAWAAMTRPAPTAQPASLDGAEDITFFTPVPVEGRGFTIMTGTAFATPADFTSGNVDRRWCYVMLGSTGSVPRQVELGNREGSSPPVFVDLSIYRPTELSELGVAASELSNLARRDCRFGQ